MPTACGRSPLGWAWSKKRPRRSSQQRSISAGVIGSAVLGIANAVLKPLLTILTLPLIIITLGFFYLLINIAMVALAEWIAPDFSIDGFWAYVGTVIVVWAVNWIGGQVLGDMERRSRPRFSF